MSEFSTYEYVVAQKIEGKWRLKKLGLLLLYVAFIVAWFIFGFVSHLFPLLALMPVTLWMLVFFTWRYIKVEYEYSMTSGDVMFSNIYGGRSRKTVIEFRLKDCSLIAPLSTHEHKARDYEPEIVYRAVSSEKAQDVYFALFEKDGKRCIVYFEATAKALKICRFYNAPATVMSEVRF
ncbi:MAG: hypothetical protein IJZ89_00430 [Clostridia bacterium]|nr:hypothetical protein [Clostridia bacterium]